MQLIIPASEVEVGDIIFTGYTVVRVTTRTIGQFTRPAEIGNSPARVIFIFNGNIVRTDQEEIHVLRGVPSE